MTVYLYACSECDESDLVERESAPRFCPACGIRLHPSDMRAIEEPPEDDPEDPTIENWDNQKAQYHRKRRKLAKILKVVVGEEALSIVTDKDLVKMTIAGRMEKAMKAMEMDESEQADMLESLDKGVEELWEKVSAKLK